MIERVTLHAGRPGWANSASRWVQLTFAENDPESFDLSAWEDVIDRTHANALCLSAGGYVAYYPTALPFHHRSQSLGTTDLFGEVVDMAKSRGMAVLARVDPHAVHEDAAAAHPDWLARTPDGKPVRHASFPGAWLTCVHSDYYHEHITAVVSEIMRDYPVDGIFANRWEGIVDPSWSTPARTRFKNRYGRDLPNEQRPDDPAWSDYFDWRRENADRLLRRWDNAVRAQRPSARFIPNRSVFLRGQLNPQLIDRMTPIFVVDKQGRWGRDAAWVSGRAVKRGHGVYDDRSVSTITSVGPEHLTHRWKDAVETPAEILTKLAEGIVHGGNPWISKFNARIEDPRWIGPTAQAFSMHHAVEPLLRTTSAAPSVLILENLAVDESDPRLGTQPDQDDETGLYQALTELRVPFGLLADYQLTSQRLEGIDLLILPDSCELTLEQAAVIQKFVADGGGLIAMDRASLSTRTEEPTDFALARTLGIRSKGDRRSGVKNLYVAFTDPVHPLAHGFAGVSRVVAGSAVTPIEAAEPAHVPLRFVPDFPDLPMEEVYAREPATEPAVVCTAVEGHGRTVYFAFNIGETFWDALQNDHVSLLGNAIEWVLESKPRLRLSGIGMLDIAVRTSADATVVGIVNLDNAMSMRGQAHWIRPSAPQILAVPRPAGAKDVSVRQVLADQEVAVSVSDDCIVVKVPPIDVMEFFELRWSGATT